MRVGKVADCFLPLNGRRLQSVTLAERIGGAGAGARASFRTALRSRSGLYRYCRPAWARAHVLPALSGWSGFPSIFLTATVADPYEEATTGGAHATCRCIPDVLTGQRLFRRDDIRLDRLSLRCRLMVQPLTATAVPVNAPSRMNCLRVISFIIASPLVVARGTVDQPAEISAGCFRSAAKAPAHIVVIARGVVHL